MYYQPRHRIALLALVLISCLPGPVFQNITTRGDLNLSCSCVTPWLPEHDQPASEAPPEVIALQGLLKAIHNRCMQSERFMAAIEGEAARMTARQVEQLQVGKTQVLDRSSLLTFKTFVDITFQRYLLPLLVSWWLIGWLAGF